MSEDLNLDSDDVALSTNETSSLSTSKRNATVTDPDNHIHSRDANNTSVLAEIDMGSDDEHDWEDYNPSKFGPDVVVTSGASSSSSSTNVGLGMSISNSVNNSHGASGSGSQSQLTPALDADNEIELLTSSQQSFSYLNINHTHEDPYSADVDIGLDF